MVLDTAEGHRETGRRLATFLASGDEAIEITAAGRCPLDPALEPLGTFRMVKAAGPIHTQELPGGVLQVSGRPDLLERYLKSFDFGPGVEDDHHHPEQAFTIRGELDARTAFIIIEADSEATE